MLVRTFIAASSIEGVGVFAGEPIRRGKPIWAFDPRFDLLIPPADYRASPPHLKELFDRYSYPSQDRPGFLVYEIDNGRFMNHSERPNTDFTGIGGRALEDIAAGEELTCNYAEFYPDFRIASRAEQPAIHARM
jgi:SET domain-containing protein